MLCISIPYSYYYSLFKHSGGLLFSNLSPDLLRNSYLVAVPVPFGSPISLIELADNVTAYSIYAVSDCRPASDFGIDSISTVVSLRLFYAYHVDSMQNFLGSMFQPVQLGSSSPLLSDHSSCVHCSCPLGSETAYFPFCSENCLFESVV